MAKRLNKQMVLGLTIASMILTTIAMVVVIKLLPQRDPKPAALEAERLVREGDFVEAVKKYQIAARRAKAVQDLDQYAEYMVLAGETALKAGSAIDARQCWQDVMLNDPKNEAAPTHILELLLEFAKYGGVQWPLLQTEAERLVAINSQNAVGLHALGLALVQQRTTNPRYAEEGEKRLIEAIRSDKGKPEYVNRLAQFYVAVDRHDDAEKLYDQLVAELENQRTAAPTATVPAESGTATQPSTDSVARRLAEAYLMRGSFHTYKAERLHLQAASAAAAQARLLEAQSAEAEAKARADLEKAAAASSDNADALTGLARFWQTRRPPGETEQERARKRDEYRTQAKTYYEQAIKTAPDTFDAYQGLARVYLGQNEPEKALEVLKLRLGRGYNRKHYLAEIDTIRMMNLREDCFKINMTRLYAALQKPSTASERSQAEKAILDEMTELYNQTVADTAAGEQHQWALFMKGRLLMVENNINGAIAKLEQAAKTFQSPPPEQRQTLASLYLRTRAFTPAVTQLELLVSESPSNTAAWTMLGEARLQSADPASPTYANTLTAASNAVKEALRYDANNRQALDTLARIYRAMGDEASAREVISQMGISPQQLKLSEAIQMVMQAGSDEAKIANAEKVLKELLASDPLNMSAIEMLVRILSNRHAKAQDAEKPGIADAIRKIIDDARAAVSKKLAEASSATQPAAERERYSNITNAIERFAITSDPNLSDEEKIRGLERLIKEGEDPYQIAAQLFDVYRRTEKTTAQAAEQATKILAMDLQPDQGAVVEEVFLFAIRNQDWPLAEKCIALAAKTGLDPSPNGHLYWGRLFLAKAGAGVDSDDSAKKARDSLQLAVNASPQHAMAHVWLGFAYVGLKQYADAKRVLDTARQIDPQNGLALVGLGMLAEAQGDIETLNSVLSTCEKIIPQNPWVQSRLASRREQMDPTQAIARREAIRKEKPQDLANLLALAALYGRVNRQDDALKAYQECHAIEPANVQAAERCATLLTQRRDFDAAEKVLDKLAQSVDQNDAQQKATVQLLRAALVGNKLKYQYGGVPASQQAGLDNEFLAAAKISDRPEVINNLVKYFRMTGRIDETLSWQRRFVEAVTKHFPQLDAQKEPRMTLIDMLLQTGDIQRGPEIEKEISDFRGLFPEDHRADLFEGRLNAMKGDDAKTIESFSNYIKNVPQDATGYSFRGQTYLLIRRWNEGIKDLQEVKRLDPTFQDYSMRILLARAYNETGQFEAAISELQSILGENSNHLPAIETLIGTYESKAVGRRAATDSLLTARAQADPRNPLWPTIRANVAMNRGQHEEAVRFAQEAVEKSKDASGAYDPARIDFFFRRCLNLGRFDELLSFVKDKMPPAQQTLPIVHLYVASAHAGKHDAEKAIEHYLASLEGEDIELGVATGMILADISSGRLTADAAAAAAKKRADAEPDNRVAKLLLLLVQRDQREASASIQAFRELANSVKPDNAKDKAILLWLKAQMADLAHQKTRQYDEAAKLYREMIELDPRQTVALNNLAYLLLSYLNDPKAALPHAEAAVEIAPNNGNVIDTLGWCHLLLKNYDEAVARLRQATQLEPDAASIRYHAAEAFYQRASADGAKSREADLDAAKTEVQRAYELISKNGKDPENIIGKVIELGGKLGLSLNQPASAPATEPKP
ncbi:MAG: tetratricopeptide repeat protein [Phycisphaerae bacterium]|nr:tetratricopeptide repeat protein [Phycisphaerae bacterium]